MLIFIFLPHFIQYSQKPNEIQIKQKTAWITESKSPALLTEFMRF